MFNYCQHGSGCVDAGHGSSVSNVIIRPKKEDQDEAAEILVKRKEKCL